MYVYSHNKNVFNSSCWELGKGSHSQRIFSKDIHLLQDDRTLSCTRSKAITAWTVKGNSFLSFPCFFYFIILFNNWSRAQKGGSYSNPTASDDTYAKEKEISSMDIALDSRLRFPSRIQLRHFSDFLFLGAFCSSLAGHGQSWHTITREHYLETSSALKIP